PNCGMYQVDMARKLKDEASINSLQIAGLVVVVLSLLALGIPYKHVPVLTIVFAAVGVGLAAYGYVVAFRFDPNAGDPEARKTLGRRYAVWGEQLMELLATKPAAGPRTMEWYEAGWHYYEQTRPDGDRLLSIPTEWQRELAALAILDEQINN